MAVGDRKFLTGRTIVQCDNLAPHEPHWWNAVLQDEETGALVSKQLYCNGS